MGGEVTISCEDAWVWLMQLEPSSLDAIVCSPPYADARGADYPCVPIEEYAAWTAHWTEAALEAVKPEGSLLLNIGHIYRDGQLSPYHLQALSAAVHVGWLWLDELVWYKPNANPIQGNWVTAAHEYVYVLGKSPKPYCGADDIRRPYAEGSAARYERGWKNNTGVKGQHTGRGRTLNPKGARAQSVRVHTTGKEKGNPHPCPMPLDLAVELVLLSTPPGGLVGCPFSGSGTVALAALQTGRSFTGCDIDPASVELARSRIAAGSVAEDTASEAEKRENVGERTRHRPTLQGPRGESA
jgi:DNA modification methylase